jgi:ArsR family transcriptional regulator
METSEENIIALATAFKALSDPVRLKLLKELTRQYIRKDIGVCDLAKKLNISQPNVSHHLKILKTAGIIKCEKRDNFCFYVINNGRLNQLNALFSSHISLPAASGEPVNPVDYPK